MMANRKKIVETSRINGTSTKDHFSANHKNGTAFKLDLEGRIEALEAKVNSFETHLPKITSKLDTVLSMTKLIQKAQEEAPEKEKTVEELKAELTRDLEKDGDNTEYLYTKTAAAIRSAHEMDDSLSFLTIDAWYRSPRTNMYKKMIRLLQALQIKTMEELTQKSWREIVMIPRFGISSCLYLREALRDMNVTLKDHEFLDMAFGTMKAYKIAVHYLVTFNYLNDQEFKQIYGRNARFSYGRVSIENLESRYQR